MALTTYTELLASVASWLHRTDLTSTIPDLVTLAEAEMNARITSRRQIARSDTTISAEFMALPTDFAGMRWIKLTSGTYPHLTYIGPEVMADLKAGAAAPSGQPNYYTIVGTEFEFDVSPDASYTCEIAYVQRIPALSVSNATNWVLTNFPNAYLFGALTAAAPFLRDDGRVATWGALFTSAIDGINAQSINDSQGGALTPSPSGMVV